jgi:hypothetical protein
VAAELGAATDQRPIGRSRSALRSTALEHSPLAADENGAQGHPQPTCWGGGEQMKARYYRIFGSLTVLSAVTAVLAAPKKWG